MTLLALAAATLVSEDAACIAAGVLIGNGTLDATTGVLGCALGIFVGDLGLWALGRLCGRAALAWSWTARRLRSARVTALASRLERGAGWVILASRFLPGTRLPLYVASGVLRLPVRVFAGWSFLAVMVWVPPLVLLTAWVGETVVGQVVPARDGAGRASLVTGATMVALLLALRSFGRRLRLPRLPARLARLARWEFWPMWLFYAPVVAWVAILSIRYRGIGTLTAANPGIPDGGTVGESKHQILRRLPPEVTIPSVLIAPGPLADRIARSAAHLRVAGWSFPVVLKPDVGQRGVGVRLARRASDVADYLSSAPGAVLMQPYHPGPFEAGVFYYRRPGAPRGRILSITDKHFPVLVGDGRSSIEALIRAHPRYRLQAATFMTRHCRVRHRVLAPGERFQLAIAGNHAQGTMFRDGRHLLTAALERRIDAIAQAYPGFFVGRFDIRYRDVDAFKAGLDIAIVELNGATAEATSIYDPHNTLIGAYRLLFRQWAIVFAIGAANRAQGARPSSFRRVCALVRAHLARPVAFPVSD